MVSKALWFLDKAHYSANKSLPVFSTFHDDFYTLMVSGHYGYGFFQAVEKTKKSTVPHVFVTTHSNFFGSGDLHIS